MLHHLIRIAATFVLMMSPLAHARANVDEERCYIVELDGDKVGYGIERARNTADGGRAFASDMRFSIARGAAVIDLSVSTEFIEAADGAPLSMSATTAQGAQVTTERYIWQHGNRVEHRTESAARVRTEVLPAPTTPWLTPSRVDELVKARLAEGAASFAYAALDPTVGLKPILTTVTVVEKTTVELMGKNQPALKWIVRNSATPGLAITSFVDLQGATLLTEMPIGGFTLTMRLATRDEALADFRAPELMVATLLRSDRPIEQPRLAQRAAYVLTATKGDLPDFPATGIQTPEPIDLTSLRLRINLDAPAPAEVTPDERRALLASVTMADAEDPVIARLATEALADGVQDASASARAEALRRFVGDYITAKNLDVGFATASDVARTREGDCSEHAVLLVALLRHQRIPARAVSGLVYIDAFLGEQQIFGYHMWAQALLPIDESKPELGLTWRDLDAAIAQRPCDATHIAIALTDLSDGAMVTSMTDIARVLGNLSIKVESVEHAPADAPIPAEVR